jgi:YYY domain-containing protein
MMLEPKTTPRRNPWRQAMLPLALLAILVIGAAFRFYNVNWDEGTYHIHPDERHTTMVITAIQWPASLAEYFDTSRSPLNPRNVNMVFFYGTLPLFLTKGVATLINQTGYDQIHLVGRVLSGIFDLGSVLLLFFVARWLFDWRAGLLASFLLALTVLNIQASHYFAADTFLTFFVLLTIWFTLDVAERGDWPSFAALGISMGLTLACKVSVFLLALIVALGAWFWVRRRAAAGHDAGQAFLRAAGGLALAALVAIAVFRVAQPYAWAGPHYDRWDSIPPPWQDRAQLFRHVPEPIRAVIMPNPQWIADVVAAGAQQTGEADLPWGRQWTERTPWIYPLQNMVVWGMGLPLGIAAWLGVGLLLSQLLRAWRRGLFGADPKAPPSQRWRLAWIPLAWVVLTFLWQGMQYVKSIRYFLPIYPFLAAFAAYLIVTAWDWAGKRPRLHRGARMAARGLAALLGGVVLLGTVAWAFAFIQIYTEPITRVQATRWMYEQIEPGAAIANEHFDDPLPFNLDGRIAFGAGSYRGLDLTLYDEDTPEKLEKLLDVLDEADYISMSSGRLWQSIPRLPMRYPVTTRYYDLLFAGELGFEKAAEFHSYPRLFGIEFDDTWAEEQFTVYDHPKVLIYRKTADFDRERVRALLSEGIDWDSIPHWLNPRDVPEWKRTHLQRNDLKMSPAQRQVQEQGGTWASIFNRNSLVNRWPTFSWLLMVGLLGLTALPLSAGVFRSLSDRGYILSRPIGVLFLAWLSWILTNLTPLPYSRGTILLAWGLIALGSLLSLASARQRRRLVELWQGSRGLILVNEILFLSLFGLFWLIRWGNPDLWHPWMGGEKPMDFAYLNAVVKSTTFPPYDPWFAGGYLNYYYFGQVMVGTLIKLVGIVPAVAYNLVIPLWFAMTATGAFCVTYNLVAARDQESGHSSSEPIHSQGSRPAPQPPALAYKPLFFGLVGALFVALVGNLGQAQLILLKLGEGRLESFRSTIPGLVGLARTVAGLFEVVVRGQALPISLNEWYWNASRVIPSGPGESVINEFPFFTFLYADLHAHLIAMPLAFVSLAIALSVVCRHPALAPSSPRPGGGSWLRPLRALAPLLLWSLAIGAMRTTNTWDVPPHLIIAAGALAIAAFSTHRDTSHGLGWPILDLAWKFGLLFLLSWSVLYRPFWANYGSFYNRLGMWSGTRTPLWAFLVVHGLFFLAIVSYLLVRVLGKWPGLRPDPLLRRLRLTVRYRSRPIHLRRIAQALGVSGVPVNKWLLVAISLLFLAQVLFLVPGLLPGTQPKPDALQADGFAYRGLVLYALGLPVAVLGLLLLFRRGLGPAERLWAYLVLLALAMALGVEIVVLQGDIGRMNTVFKFYLQVWLLWGVAAAAALAWLAPRLRLWQQGRRLWLGLLVSLLLVAALYPPLAASAKIRDRFDPDIGPGLSGWDYMQTAYYYDPQGAAYELKWDLEAIKWMLDNIVGSPVILEGHTSEYRWGGRYSVYTGLPTVLGWNWHQRQQRAAVNDQEVWKRAGDIAQIYNVPIPGPAELLLHEYRVQYIVVGPLERAYYEEEGLQKFESMVAEGTLQIAFRNGEVTVYRMVR